MNSDRYDGSLELKNNASFADAERKLRDPAIASVALHKSGSVVERSINGKRVKFQVNDAGEWVVKSPLVIGLPVAPPDTEEGA